MGALLPLSNANCFLNDHRQALSHHVCRVVFFLGNVPTFVTGVISDGARVLQIAFWQIETSI
jgi:hypothetical protein